MTLTCRSFQLVSYFHSLCTFIGCHDKLENPRLKIFVCLQIVTFLLDNGAHIDSRNYHLQRPVDLLSVIDSCKVNPLQYTTLKCLAARTITAYNLQYKNEIPAMLEEFVEAHWGQTDSPIFARSNRMRPTLIQCGKHHFDVRYRRKLLYLLTVTQKPDSAACSCNVHFSLYCDFTICVWCCNRKRISHVCNVLELYQRIDVIYYYKNNSVFCKFIRVYNRNKQTTHIWS